MKDFILSILPKNVIKKLKSLRKRRNEKIYAGDDVHCPICNSSYREFSPAGLSKRKNARCHNCDSLERHRLMYVYLKDEVKLFDERSGSLRLLHFAPEDFFYELLSNINSINYTPCDLYPELFEFEGKTKVAKVDITNIPFEDESFDFILCSHVLEHIPDDHLAMKELYRVMAKNGSGIFQVPLDTDRMETYEDWSITTPKEREKAFGQVDHVRCYGQDYADRLRKVGFTVNVIDYPSNFTSEDIFKYGFMESEKIYHVSK